MSEYQDPGEQRYGKRPSLFWPVVLIGAGIIWLLATANIITLSALNLLVTFWPLILVFVGLDLLIGHRRPLLGLILGVLFVATVAGLLIAGPTLEERGILRPNTWAVSQEVLHRDLAAPLDGASTATIDLDLSSWPTQIDTLVDSDELMTAAIDYAGTLDWRAARVGEVMEVSLDHQQAFSLAQVFSHDYKWDLAISPAVPVELTLRGDSGPVAANLSQLQLTAFTFDGGSGPVDIKLPADSTSTLVSHIEGGSGALRITLPDGGEQAITLDGSSGSYNLSFDAPTALALTLDTSSGAGRVSLASGSSADIELHGGSGSTTIVLEGTPGIRFILEDRGSGSVNLPGRMQQSAGSDDDHGTWETDGFAAAAERVIIRARLSSGSFTLRN